MLSLLILKTIYREKTAKSLKMLKKRAFRRFFENSFGISKSLSTFVSNKTNRHDNNQL